MCVYTYMNVCVYPCIIMYVVYECVSCTLYSCVQVKSVQPASLPRKSSKYVHSAINLGAAQHPFKALSRSDYKLYVQIQVLLLF